MVRAKPAYRRQLQGIDDPAVSQDLHEREEIVEAIRSAVGPVLQGMAKIKTKKKAKEKAEDKEEAENNEKALLERLVAVGHRAAVDMRELRQSSTLENIRAENRDLEQALVAAAKKLRGISLEHERALSIDFDNLGLAKQIEAGLVLVRNPDFSKAKHPGSQAREKHVTLELTLAVRETLKAHGIPATATAGYGPARDGAPSIAIQVLQAIGGEVGLVRSKYVWRDLLSESKRIR